MIPKNHQTLARAVSHGYTSASPATAGAGMSSGKTPTSHDLTIHESFLGSIGSPDLKDLTIDITQVTLESITDIEVLKRLPVVGALAHLCGAVKTVRDRFNLKKIFRFFRRIGNMPLEECDAFLQRMRADPHRAQQVTEAFLVWLDRLDDEEKADLLARVFELYARRRIDFAPSARFAAIIDRAHVPYLRQLRDFSHPDDDVKSHLLALGLLTMRGTLSDLDRHQARDVGRGYTDIVKLELNDDGRVFKDYVIQEKPDRSREPGPPPG